MELLKFIFSSFWTWAGTLILIYVPLVCIVQAIEAFRTAQRIEQKKEPVKCQFALRVANGWVHREGEFLCWGSDAGPGNYTVALIKLPDGQVVKAQPDKVKFGGSL